MKKHLLKFLLTALVLLTGWGSSAWALTVTETYDFGGFITANGAPGMSLGSEVVATQSGTSTYTGGDLYLLKNPSNNGQTLELNERFAIDYGSNANQQIRFMWRTSSNAYQHGLAGQWNGKGNANTACHMSVLNLKAGDKITMTWTVQSGKAAQPFLCASGVVTGVAADANLASGTEYTIAKDGNLDLYFKNNNFAVSKIVIVTEKEGNETMGAPTIEVTGVNGSARIITITPGVGDGGSEATATYYTLDGTEPTATNGTPYSEPFSITATSTVKAVSYLSDAIGEVQTKEVEAGVEIKLNTPTFALSEITEGEGKTYTVSSDNSGLLLKPTASFSYVFTPSDGSDPVSGTGASITVQKFGTIEVTATADGYASSDAVSIVNDTEYEIGESLSLKDMDVLVEDDASWTYNSTGTRYANWSGYNGVSKANYPYWTPTTDGKGQIGNFSFVPNDNVLMRTVGFIHNSGDANLSVTDLPDNTTVKFVVSTYSSNPTNVFVDAVDGTATYRLGAGSTGYAVESVQLYKKVVAIVPAAPTFNPEATTEELTGAQTVTLTCETDGAAIYYTLNGTVPTDESTLYSEPISISETTTVKAIAVLGKVSSEVAEATYTIAPKQGDVSGDNDVTVSDAVLVVSFALGTETPTDVQKKAADINKDDEITVSDAVGVVNIALQEQGDDVNDPSRQMERTVNYLTQNGNTIGLMSGTDFVAFQMDVTLNDGTLLGGIEPSERVKGLQLMTNRIGQNIWRIVAFAPQGGLVSQGEGELLRLNTVGDGQASVSRIEFTDATAQAYKLELTGTTAINGVASATNANSEAYCLNGMCDYGQHRGLSIVRTADGSVRKVLVK